MDTSYYKQYEPLFNYWTITRMIGEGGFGKVFEIERREFGTTYRAALKTITIPASASELERVLDEGSDAVSAHEYFRSVVEELVQEFELMAQLKGNSNIVSYEDHEVIEHADGVGWDVLIRMELLTPLNAYIRQNGITRGGVIRLGLDMCAALNLCAKHKIIHRDVKPENIFISGDGFFKLGDFGVSCTMEKATAAMSRKGTYYYMAPEVYRGEPYGASVDLYSLGVVLYRLLNDNRVPFMPPSPSAITLRDHEAAIEKRVTGAPMPPPRNADERLARIILRACAFRPEERYQSAEELCAELAALPLDGQDERLFAPAPTDGGGAQKERGAKRPGRALPWIAAGAAALCVCGLIAWRALRAEPAAVSGGVSAPETSFTPISKVKLDVSLPGSQAVEAASADYVDAMNLMGELADGKTTIHGFAKGFSTELLHIGEAYGAYPVAAIGSDAFQASETLRSVSLPDGVETIGSGAFCSCRALESVRIPASVSRIGGEAFYNCEKLRYVEMLSTALTTIGEDAFCGCAALTHIDLPEGLTKLEKNAFWGCGQLAALELPETLSAIGVDAFGKCAALERIAFPGALQTISEGALYQCASLTEAAFGVGVTTIQKGVFTGCASLKKITLPASVTYIDPHALPSDCKAAIYVAPGSYAEQWCNENGFTANVRLTEAGE